MEHKRFAAHTRMLFEHEEKQTEKYYRRLLDAALNDPHCSTCRQGKWPFKKNLVMEVTVPTIQAGFLPSERERQLISLLKKAFVQNGWAVKSIKLTKIPNQPIRSGYGLKAKLVLKEVFA